jgi:flagellar protein FliO/FliZ
MQFLTSLFGGSESTAITAVLALGIVLVLIVLGLWVLKLFFKASTNIGRGRNRRLTVIDSVAIDPKRQLLIVRRDNVEHLLLTGGPQDVVVETGIAVEPLPRAVRRPVPIGRDLATPADSAAPTDADPEDDSTGSQRTPVEHLRDYSRPAGQRKSASLRHTGLMRPVSHVKPAVIPMNPEKSDRPGVDSATSSPANVTNGQTRLGAGKLFGDAFKAEGS